MTVSELDILRFEAEKAKLARVAAEETARTALIQRASTMAAGDFDSARRTRLRPGPRPRGGSADSHRDYYTLDYIRRDTQSLIRNDKLASSMVKRTCDFVVGDRIGIQVRSADTEFNARAEKWLNRWWSSGVEHRAYERVDGGYAGRGGTQLCRLAVRSALASGGVLCVLTDRGTTQFVEYERLKSPPGSWTNQTVVNGVEYQDAGAGPVVRYHITDWRGDGSYAGLNTRPIDARNVLNLANPHDDEVNVTIPEPGLARLVEDFSIIRNYIRDTQIASRMATLFGLITKTEAPQDAGLMLPGSVLPKVNAGGATYSARELELEPGFIGHLAPNESIEQIDPKQPTTQFGDFVMSNLSMIGAECGLPLVLWMLDMTKVNFASARSALLLAGRTFDVWREWLRCQFIVPVVRWRLAMALRSGEIEGPIPDDWDSIEAMFPPLPVLDSLSQYQAEAFAVEKGLKTHKDAWMTLNSTDHEEGLEQMAYERKRREELGILPVGTPGQFDPNIGRGQPPSPTTDAPDANDDSEDAD